jgi:hydroxymethylglutaryl-CoA lyase
VDEVVVFGAASETFSQKNINCSIAQSMERFAPVVRAAHEAGVATRGAVSVAMGCPYEGEVTPAAVRDVVQRMHDIGVQRVAVADTVGRGTPRHTHEAMQAALAVYPLACVTGHFHNTYGQALANTLVALQMGISTFETSVAGLGGCPYSPGATGNVATEDVVYMLHGMGIDTGIDLTALVAAAQTISAHLGRAPQSAVARALLAKAQAVC